MIRIDKKEASARIAAVATSMTASGHLITCFPKLCSTAIDSTKDSGLLRGRQCTSCRGVSTVVANGSVDGTKVNDLT